MSENAAPAPASAPAAKAAPAAPAPAPAPAAAPAQKVTAHSLKRRQFETSPTPEPEAVEAPAARAGAEHEPEPDVQEAPDSDPVAVEEPDEGTVEPDPNALPEAIHGVPLKDLIEALQNGQLPDALWEVLQGELVDGEEREPKTLKEIRDGAMLLRNYTKKTMALAEERKAHETKSKELNAEREELYGMVRSWKDPVKFRKAAKSMGLPLEQVAIMWAEEFDKRSKLPPEMIAELDAHEAREMDLEKRARELRAQERKLRDLEQGQGKVKLDADVETYITFIKGHQPKAFEAAGLQPTPATQKMIFGKFQECLGVFWPDNKTAPTKEAVYQAAQAAAELLGIKKGPAQAAPPPAKSPAAQQVAALQSPARRQLAGPASYDSGKASSPARKTVSAQNFKTSLRNARSGK